MSKSLASIMGDPRFLRRLTEVIGKIPRQDNAAEVTSIVGEVVAMLECKGAVFASFTKNDEEFESHRYIAACPASWCALYVQRRWFAIDPFLIYAQRHTEISVGDEIPIATEGQRLFLRHAQTVGFRSIAIVPCHSAYPVMLLIALLPPLFERTMRRRLVAWMAAHGNQSPEPARPCARLGEFFGRQ